jgi:phosphate transport system substrate-binding protein
MAVLISDRLRFLFHVLGVFSLILLASCRPSADHLLLAAKQGDTDQIRRLLDRKMSVTVTDRDGQTPLHLAAHWGRDAAAALLLDRGAPIEATDHEGRTPLHAATKENQQALVGLLLNRGARPDAVDLDGSTPLHLAAEWNAGDAARVLLERGAAVTVQDKEGLTPLHAAAVWGSEQVAILLLDARAPVEATGHRGQTPLHLTTKGSRRMFETVKGQVAIAQLLLDRGARVDAAMGNGDTSLHLAAQEGDLDMVRLLIERGAAIDARTRNGRTPLHRCVEHNQTPVVRLLLERGANSGIPDGQGKSPAHLAAELGQASILRLLLDRGASVASVDAEQRTPLHEPAGRGHEAVVRLLLERGADFRAADRFGWTPLHLATFHGREPIVRLLLDRGAVVDAGDAQGVTPLHAAAFYGYEEIRQLLTQRGATVDLVDDRGYTAAQYARPQPRAEADDDPASRGTVQVVRAAQGEVVRLHLPLIKVDGSSTVYPLSTLIAEQFAESAGGAVRVSVGISGTGGGFQKFCQGQIDVQGASRPISADESELCQRHGVKFYELPVGYDALSVVVSTSNSWVESLTLKDLKAMWEPAAHQKIMSWSQIRSEWPAAPLKLFGAGPNSGSFDYFTEAIVGKVKASRADYTGSEDDNVLVDAIAESRLALGYVPFAYLEPNHRRLKAVAIDAGKGPVLPTKETVVSGRYYPLSRPLFIYVNQRSSIDGAVRQFVERYLTHAPDAVEQARYVPFRREFYPTILSKFQKGRTGTIFEGKSPIGMTIEQFLAVQDQS